MDINLQPEKLHRLLPILIGAACLPPIISLLGWYVSNPMLTQGLPGRPAMSVNTALSLLVTAVALAAAQTRLCNLAVCLLLNSAVILFLAIEFASIFEPMVGANWEILRLPTLLVSSSPSTLSSPHTSLAMVCLLAAAQLLIFSKPYEATPQAVHSIQILAITSLTTALIGALGYITRQPHLFQVNPELGMSIPTILSTTLASLAFFLYFPNQGLNREVLEKGSGGKLLRRFLPLTAISFAFILIINSLTVAPRYQFLPTLLTIVVVVALLLGLLLLATRLNRAERLKAHAEQHYYGIFEASPDGLLVVDATGHILEANQQIELLSGYSKQKLLSSTVELLIPQPLHRHHKALRDNFISSGRSDRPMSSAQVISLCDAGNNEIPVNISITSVSKDNSTSFIVAIRDQREQQQIKQRLDTLKHVAMHDPLTNLPNRNLLNEFSERVFSIARRNQTLVAVCFCDLDGFKQINDNYGHQAGDEFLKTIANRLKDSVREQDIVARFGGDEFIILLTGLQSEEDAERSINTLLQAIPQPVDYRGQNLSVTVSIGVSFFPKHGEDLTALEKKADSSLYESKKRGKNTFTIHASA